jgi:hypothetical protein
MKIGEATSRVRNIMKSVKDDAFITDRFLYSLIIKYGKALLRREDNRNRLMRVATLFRTVPCLELIEVDKVEACCLGIDTGCYIMRTKEKLPAVMDGVNGPLIRMVSSIDRSVEVHMTYPEVYSNMSRSTNFKYNKNKYYWFLNGYLYMPNMTWESVLVDALFEDDIAHLQCCDEGESCTPRQEQIFALPDYLFAEIENMVKQDLGIAIQIPSDGADDKQNVSR